jgi:hypothetical protein
MPMNGQCLPLFVTLELMQEEDMYDMHVNAVCMQGGGSKACLGVHRTPGKNIILCKMIIFHFMRHS